MAGGRGGRRTYVRDGRGRFASTGTTRSRPAPKRAATRGTNRLTRDNAGRIAGVGRNGATARGGRLRTAAGNQRATQTARLARQGGTIAKPKGLKPGALKPRAAKPATRRSPATSRLRPGELMNAVARPVNTMAKPKRGENPFHLFAGPKHVEKNLRIAEEWARQRGIRTYRFDGTQRSDGTGNRIAEAGYGQKNMGLNQSHPFWQSPRRTTLEGRRSGWWSSSSPTAILYHEAGHTRDTGGKQRWLRMEKDGKGSKAFEWKAVAGGGGPATRLRRAWQMRDLAGRVSGYARKDPGEFIAETYAGLRTGRRYDYQVMRAYREAMGLPATPPARRRSRIRRPKP